MPLGYPATSSPSGGGRHPSEWVAGLARNQWPACVGIRNLYVKRLSRLAGGRLALVSENAALKDQYPILYLDQAEDCTLWGVVTGSVRRF